MSLELFSWLVGWSLASLALQEHKNIVDLKSAFDNFNSFIDYLIICLSSNTSLFKQLSGVMGK